MKITNDAKRGHRDTAAALVTVTDTGGNFTGTDLETILDELADEIDALAGNGLIQMWLDGGGATLTTGLKAWTSPMPKAGVITAAYLDGDVDGAIVVDVGKGTTWAGSHFGSICASAKPTITATGGTDLTYTDTTLTGWTTAFAVGSRFSFNIDSVVSFTKMMVGLRVQWTA